MIIAENTGKHSVKLSVVDPGSNFANSSIDTGKVGFTTVLDATRFGTCRNNSYEDITEVFCFDPKEAELLTKLQKWAVTGKNTQKKLCFLESMPHQDHGDFMGYKLKF